MTWATEDAGGKVALKMQQCKLGCWEMEDRGGLGWWGGGGVGRERGSAASCYLLCFSLSALLCHGTLYVLVFLRPARFDIFPARHKLTFSPGHFYCCLTSFTLGSLAHQPYPPLPPPIALVGEPVSFWQAASATLCLCHPPTGPRHSRTRVLMS